MRILLNLLSAFLQDIECRRNSGEARVGISNYSGEGICIVVPGSSGIPEWISMQEMGSEIKMELPKNWYQNNDFLGFVLCCVYVAVDDESEHDSVHTVDDESEHDSVHTVENELGDEFHNVSENESGDESENESGDESELESGDGFDTRLSEYSCCFECFFTIHGDQPSYVDRALFYSDCECHHHDNGAVPGQVWVICYPKAAIEESYHSDQWTHFMASFTGFYDYSGRTFKAKKCGVHCIYA